MDLWPIALKRKVAEPPRWWGGKEKTGSHHSVDSSFNVIQL